LPGTHIEVSTFEFYRFRFHFRTLEAVGFPAGQGANAIRGAFGAALRRTAGAADYRRLFEPGAELAASPSGLQDWPRPFVFRTAHLEGATVAGGSDFFIDVHVFDVRQPSRDLFLAAFAELGGRGIGRERGRAELVRVEQLDLEDRAAEGPPAVVLLAAPAGAAACSAVRLRFITPTELKWKGQRVDRPEFGILFARLRDRISTLRALYGAGPLALDFSGMGGRAERVRLARCDLRYAEAQRRSARTGQVHPLGGFTGEAEYTGALAEFLPWLRAARWVGVGRQTVWGKGDVRVIP